ncbi:PD-(D/E)XK nuclease family protein [Mesoflavibacter zeaxanthinifaciens]|uniref:PDDEXK-like family protein n=1 Tax=Mesoflavibacter zeaxanthinifaciens TaxID=393060 RepID=UPI003A8E47D6
MNTLLDFTQLDYFLKEIALFNKAQTPLREREKFNIFTIIRNGHEEVGLHSKFLFELLSPEGSHKKKALFLKLFIQQLGVDFRMENIEVFCEKNNIDLLIQNNSQAIIIENKINAGDQPEQLSRYYNIVHSSKIKDIHIVYLSLDGKEPCQQSIENLPDDIKDNRLYNKSYKKFINPWLSLCVKECATQPEIRETIVQYKQLLNHLTMSNDIKEREALLNFLGKGDNMKQAHYIADNWIHMKWHTEWEFWNDFYNQIPDSLKGLPIVEEFLFSSDKLDNAIHYERNRNYEYGLAIKLFEYNNEDICLYIERNSQRLFYGIIVDFTKDRNNDNDWNIKSSSDIQLLSESLTHSVLGHDRSPWIVYQYPKKQINFEHFNHTDTLDLANQQKRLQMVVELWDEIKDFVDIVIDWKTNLN